MYVVVFFFFFKQKTAYEMRISDWSSDVCSSDLSFFPKPAYRPVEQVGTDLAAQAAQEPAFAAWIKRNLAPHRQPGYHAVFVSLKAHGEVAGDVSSAQRSEEHTSELQSLMRISYAVFCLKKHKITNH